MSIGDLCFCPIWSLENQDECFLGIVRTGLGLAWDSSSLTCKGGWVFRLQTLKVVCDWQWSLIVKICPIVNRNCVQAVDYGPYIDQSEASIGVTWSVLTNGRRGCSALWTQSWLGPRYCHGSGAVCLVGSGEWQVIWPMRGQIWESWPIRGLGWPSHQSQINERLPSSILTMILSIGDRKLF